MSPPCWICCFRTPLCHQNLFVIVVVVIVDVPLEKASGALVKCIYAEFREESRGNDERLWNLQFWLVFDEKLKKHVIFSIFTKFWKCQKIAFRIQTHTRSCPYGTILCPDEDPTYTKVLPRLEPLNPSSSISFFRFFDPIFSIFFSRFFSRSRLLRAIRIN